VLYFSECLKLQSKYEKTNKLEKTGTNVAKTLEAKKAFIISKDRFDKTNFFCSTCPSFTRIELIIFNLFFKLSFRLR
jgi:hypothetical protein